MLVGKIINNEGLFGCSEWEFELIVQEEFNEGT